MSKTSYTRDHPVIRRIEEIIKSSDERAAAKQATDNGRAPLADLDPMIRKALGDEYGPLETTSWAGTFVAEVMRGLGYRRAGERRLKGCVAKRGAFFKAE